MARRLGLHLHSHLSETVDYQDAVHAQHRMKPVHFCESIGWLGPDVWYAHLVKLDADEIALLGATGTGIAHCPQSNGRLGSGIAPARELEAAGAAVSIGVDGAASNEAADMISETHAAWLMQRARAGESATAVHRGGQGEGGAAAAATIEDVVRWGTAGGARVLGLSAIGTLALGQAADIAVYDSSATRATSACTTRRSARSRAAARRTCGRCSPAAARSSATASCPASTSWGWAARPRRSCDD